MQSLAASRAPRPGIFGMGGLPEPSRSRLARARSNGDVAHANVPRKLRTGRASSRASPTTSAPAWSDALPVSGPKAARTRLTSPASVLRTSRNTPLIEEPGTNGMPVAFIRAVGRSMTSAACPVPACRGDKACSRNGRVFIGCSSLGSKLPESRSRTPPQSGRRWQKATAHGPRFPQKDVHLRAQRNRLRPAPPYAPLLLACPPPCPSRKCALAAERMPHAESLHRVPPLDLDTRCRAESDRRATSPSRNRPALPRPCAARRCPGEKQLTAHPAGRTGSWVTVQSGLDGHPIQA